MGFPIPPQDLKITTDSKFSEWDAFLRAGIDLKGVRLTVIGVGSPRVHCKPSRRSIVQMRTTSQVPAEYVTERESANELSPGTPAFSQIERPPKESSSVSRLGRPPYWPSVGCSKRPCPTMNDALQMQDNTELTSAIHRRQRTQNSIRGYRCRTRVRGARG